MPGCINKIELIHLSILSPILEGDALGLDSDPSFTLKIHRIEHLCGHLTLREAATVLNKAIGKRRLAVINMGNNRKVSYVTELSQRVGTSKKRRVTDKRPA